ncbi:MAG: hypothetical protein KDC98_07500 [Planctomycetes bacterium]|nr:hypothetical protein [Planctomycetota bacterium]
MRRLLAIAVLPLFTGCSEWFFSGVASPDRSRPVVLVETTGGIELGAATEYGILTLGRTATEGPCRVHYFLGPTPMVDDGALAATGSLFTRAEIDLKTPTVQVLARAPTAEDELLAMWTPDGKATRLVDVQLCRTPGIEGDVLDHPGEEIPTGAAILRRNDHDLRLDFVGLIAGRATVDSGPTKGRYFVFAGVDRIREMLAVPERHPVDYEPKYRPDGITVMKPIKQ